MFKKGLELMEGLFPGYKQALSDAGALNIDQIGDIYFVSLKQHKPSSSIARYNLETIVSQSCTDVLFHVGHA